jgi:hypothetical protein
MDLNSVPSSFKFKALLLSLSFFTILFCLGVGWAVVRPMPVISNLNPGGLFQSLGESRPPPKDTLLFYPRNATLLFWNHEMKTQGLPFAFYHMETTDKPEKVIAWYRAHWTQNQMFVVGKPSKKNTERSFKSIQLESLDYHKKRFLSVHISWNASKHVSEILATALTLDSKAFRKYMRENKDRPALVTEGQTPQGKPWKRELLIEQNGLSQTVNILKNRYSAEQWSLESEKQEENEACLVFKNEKESQTAFLNLRESSAGKTQLQCLTIEENP